jgi:hypothetical protein
MNETSDGPTHSYYFEDPENAGYSDGSLYERAKKKGDWAIKMMIDDGLYGTSVTCVLIGAETYSRDWVNYEIEQSYLRGNGLLGILIHNLKNQKRQTDHPGKNTFENHYTEKGDPLSTFVRVYDWKYDNGQKNFKKWVEAAARQSGRYFYCVFTFHLNVL